MSKRLAWNWTVLLAALAVGLGVGAGYGYRTLLDKELVGYRGIKDFQYEQARKREVRRRAIPGVPAVRERMLREEFGELPTLGDIAAETRLVSFWERFLMAAFGAAAGGAALYVIFWGRKRFPRRLATAFAALIACSQALPRLMLPDDALKLIRQFGGPFLWAAVAYLLYEVARDRLAARRAVSENDA